MSSAPRSHRPNASQHTLWSTPAAPIGKQQFGRDTRAAGSARVSFDDDGNLTEITPDGNRRRL